MNSPLEIIIYFVMAVVIGVLVGVINHLIANRRDESRLCRYCHGRGWNTKYEFRGLTEIVYNVTCKYCGGTGYRDRFREYAIKNGIDLVGKYKP